MNSPINRALSQFGVTEIVGRKHNPTIVNYFKEIGHKWVITDETAWCSAFVNWVALKTNVTRSGKLTARSWLNVGIKVKTPQLNDLAIFWRDKKSSWKGHVGFFIGYSESRNYIYVLGGNQNNQVNIKKYPAYRLIGFRRLQALK